MDREQSSARVTVEERSNLDDQRLTESHVAELSTSQNATWHFWYETAGSQHGVAQVPSGTMHAYQPDHDSGAVGRSMSVSEFVQTRFIPEYVVTRGSAGHAHFKAILRYVLTPEQFRCA